MKETPKIEERVFDPLTSPVDEDGEKIREVIRILDQDRGGLYNGRAACAQMILGDLLFWHSWDEVEDNEG